MTQQVNETCFRGGTLSASDDTPTVRVNSAYHYLSVRLIKPKPESSGAGAFRIIVDGRFAGVVVAAGSKELPITPGKHSIRIRWRWYSSRKVLFDISPSESVVFTANIPKTFNSVLRLFFLPRSSLCLERASDSFNRN